MIFVRCNSHSWYYFDWLGTKKIKYSVFFVKVVMRINSLCRQSVKHFVMSLIDDLTFF